MHTTDRLNAALAGRYTVDRQVGVGGMATVYLADDVRHGRKVALKVLRPELAAVIGAERFLAEIKTTAALQHPHILPLHDSGEADGTVFYVMPFVEGESLRDRIKHEKQLPVEESIQVATQVASALDYAHRQNVVHRDIKPENILLQDGQALVADFGIALAVSRSDGGTRMTETGMSLGTPHYMAPEQAMGEREITAKADVYALGCVLYEMLTGEPPFTGSTAQAIVARAVTESPRPLTIQRHTIPRHVEAAVLTALEKLPADRFASAGEFAAALTNPRFARAGATEAGVVAGGPASRRQKLLTLALGGVATLSLGAVAWTLLGPQPAAPVIRLGLTFPAAQAPVTDQPFRISPDGSSMVYVGPGDSGSTGTQLWLKAADRWDAAPIPGTANIVSFAFSPDGQWIAFVNAQQQVKKLPLTGGAAVVVADTAAPNRGVAWLEDQSIVFVRAAGRMMRRVLPTGGTPETIWTSDSATALFPEPLPGSRGVLFTRCRGGGCGVELDLFVLDVQSHDARRLAAGVVSGRYVPTGHVVYVRVDGGMLGLPFDVGSLAVAGAAVPLQDGIAVTSALGALFDVGANGSMVARSGAAMSSRPTYQMVWVDRAGNASLVDSTWTVRHVDFGANAGWALSPDGTRLAIGQATDAGDDVWIKQLPRGPLSRLSFDSAPDFRPRWARDGKSVFFSSTRTGVAAIYRRAADATGSDELVFNHPAGIFEAAFAPDGKTLALRTGGTVNQVGARDISVMRLGQDTTTKPLITTPFDEEAIALSPDGRWIAYENNETGRTEVYLRPFPNTDSGKWQVSTDGGVAPLWARNGRELFYVNGSRTLVVVPVTSGAVPQLGDRKPLFRLREELYLAEREFYTPFDIAPDGQRFMMARRIRAGEAQVDPIVLTLNWFQELRAKLGPH